MSDQPLILLPVRNLVLFPALVLPIGIGRQRSQAAAQEAARTEQPVGVVLQRDPSVDEPGFDDLYRVGTTANILRYLTAPDGSHHVVCQGVQRFRIDALVGADPYLSARIELIDEDDTAGAEIEARMLQLRKLATEALQLLPGAPAEMIGAVQSITAPSALADLVSSFMDLKLAEKQEILETFPIRERLDRVLGIISVRLEVLRLSQKIGEQARQSIDARQREYMLREQLQTIRRELGEADDDRSSEVEGLEAAIDRAGMPDEVRAHVRKEVRRLHRMPDSSTEYAMLRTYVDWLIELPWADGQPLAIDIAEARRILDHDHFGLQKVKRRIIEFLAVRKLAPEGKSPILCFVGPPGVGKTSLGQSIARAIGRPFVRTSLGGVHDEAEIRGHRRTYIGALPGVIIQQIRRAQARDGVFMLDEMDKLGSGIQGDPASALLEVLDPEQNGTFRDNYLGVPFNLSRVMFIGTANVLDAIPGPLRDRMEVIELPGYTEEEKLEIAKRYLVDRQRTANGLAAGQCAFSDAALRSIITDYTREAGCRTLERQIGAVCRHVAMRVAEGADGAVAIDAGDLPPILGARRFENEVALRTSIAGVATGLAWTPTGGDILFIEATRIPGNGRLILTGQLGDVMKESAQAALSLIKGRLNGGPAAPVDFEKSDVHIHVPAGAIPKDGPSAGVAMFIALSSLFSNTPVRRDTAMTGEISLRGLVLPVGGIKEKVVAAVRAGIRRVLLPARNRPDLEDIPQSARDRVEVVWIDTVDDAEAAVIEPPQDS